MKIFLLATIASAILIADKCMAQNLEEISLKKGAKVTGSFNANAVGYAATGISQRRDPFNWFLTGSLNFTLFGYAAPFTFSYSNTSKTFSQPFNRFNFAPQYKWIKLYTGNTSMTFSPYTLSGHLFYGGGAELTPGKWRIAMMYGRLRKAVPFNASDSLQSNNISFRRMGYGVKIGYETNGDAVTFNIFTAKDDPRSIPFVPPENRITPHQNVAMGLALSKRLSSKISINLEYALSALNTNVLANTAEEDTVAAKPTHNFIKGLLPENSTSRYFDAVSAAVSYQGKLYNLQLKYERIAPEYQTLGAYYFSNDLRNITVGTGVRLFNNKVTLNTNVGVQTNNLDQSRSSTMRRTVSSVNLQFTPNEKWNVSGSYSNFLTYTNVRSQADPFFKDNLDSLNAYQVSESMNGTLSRTLGGKENPQSIMFTAGYQRSSNNAGTEAGTQLSNSINTTLSYSYSVKPSDLTVSAGVNMYNNSSADVSTTFFGPSVNASKSLLNKTVRGSYSTSYNQTYGDSAPSSPVWNNQVSLSYAPPGKKEGTSSKSNFSLSLNVLRRLKAVGEQPAFTEMTGTFNYAYSF